MLILNKASRIILICISVHGLNLHLAFMTGSTEVGHPLKSDKYVL